MSNAWIVACRPFTGLRSLPQTLPSWSIAPAAACRLAKAKAVPPHLPCISTAPLKCHGLRPPLLRLLEHRLFSTSASFLARRPSAAAKKTAPPTKNSSKTSDANEKEDTPLPGGDLPQDKITKIFGPGTSAEQGNAFLRALQHRRVTGSLVERGVNFDGPTAFPKERALNALEYLRSAYPVDEETAAAEWAQKEAQKLEAELIERAQNLRLYQKPDQSQTLGSVYGHSELEALRKQNEELYERQKEEEERRAAIQEKEGSGKSGTLGPVKAKAELRKKEKSEWVKYYEEQAMLRKEKEPPKMSAAARILPSAFVAALVLALSYALTQTYTPPPSSARLWPDTPPALATCLALLNINLLVFLAWRFPPLWRPFNKYLLQTPGYPTALSVLGNVFSHQDPKHLFMNMLILMGAGPQLHELVGRANFLAIYLAGGVLGSLASLVASVAARNFAVSTLGASGALAATIGALLLLKDADAFTVPFFPEYRIPVSSYGLLGACLAYEVWGLTRRGQTGMDHVAHLGGYATGMAAAGAIRWQVAERRRRAEEKKREMGFLQRTFGSGKGE